MACIAVSCTPAEVAVCRGQEAVTCNSAGNDYELVDCPLGCNVTVGGCRACAADTDCTGSTPICDQTTSQCRGCAADSECESSVCGQGSCVASSSVVYASSNGSSVATGTIADPASINRAIALATTGGLQKIVRLLPGAYSTPIEVLAPTTLPLEFVATGVTISASDVGVRVRGGANVKIRGLSVTAANQAVMCGFNGDLMTTLAIDDSVLFDNVNVSSASVVTTGCALNMSKVESRTLTSSGNSMFFTTNSRFVGDRVKVEGNNSSITMQGSRISVRMTNSVLDDVQFSMNTSDSSGAGSEAYLGFNTIVMKSSLMNIGCYTTPLLTTLFENNIIVANGANAAIDGTACTLVNNVLLPQPGAPAGNIVSDPQFVGAAAKDYKLRATSPAIGAATATPTIFTDHDFEGRSRPQGSATDIGAFEQ